MSEGDNYGMGYYEEMYGLDSEPPHTQRFYCEGCQTWHETESLLEAVRAESERIRLEKETEDNDGS